MVRPSGHIMFVLTSFAFGIYAAVVAAAAAGVFTVVTNVYKCKLLRRLHL